MTQYGNNDYWNQPQKAQQDHSYNFDMPEQFGQELNFQSFETQQTTVPQASGYGNQPPNYGGSFLDPSVPSYSNIFTPAPLSALPSDSKYSPEGDNFDDEPPLLEELGINPSHILQKTLSVLNPLRATNQEILQDTDLAGPLVFCLALGGCLLLRGKMSFSYIYGIGVLSCLAFYCLLSLMATQAKVTLGAVISVLGYCLLPMVVLSGINVLITIQGTLGLLLAGICILWCAISSSKLFVTAYSMDNQQVLIAYPCALLYGVFALITIF